MVSEKSNGYEAQIKKPTIFFDIFKNNDRPMFIVVPKTLKIIDCNLRSIEFFGQCASELKKKHLYNLTIDDEVQNFKSLIELQKGKTHSQITFLIKSKDYDNGINSEIIISDLSQNHNEFYCVTIDSSQSSYVLNEQSLKDKNKDLTEQVKKMIEVNRRIVHSYDHIKAQYQELLDFQEDNVRSERKRTIGEMIEVLQDKINKPLNRILDDIQKIQDSEKKLDSTVVKRLKLIEESAENVLRLISRIAEIRDIKKMKYIELGNL